MAARAPELDLANALAAVPGQPFGMLGTTIKCGEPRSPRETGNEGVLFWVYTRGGAAPIPYMDAATQGALYTVFVVVRVRASPPTDTAAGVATARAVRDALNFKRLAGYDSVTADQSDPLYIGPNEADQEEWNVNFTLKWVA